MTTWERLTPTGSGTHILTSAGDTIDSGTIANKQHLKFEIYAIADGSVAPSFRFNSDAGTNYTRRREHNGTTPDGTNINQNELNSNGASTNAYVSGDIINIAAKEKFLIAEYVIQKTGAGQAPDRMSLTGKWANTSDAITRIQVYNSDNGLFDTGSTLTVWGADDQGTTAKDKSAITDVPAGTRYEETDTRKIFRRTGTTTTRALGDVVWSAAGSTGETISGNDVYFDNGNAWNYWARSTDDFTMGAGLATIIWKPHTAGGSPSQHTMVGFGKDPISADAMNFENIEFYQYIEGTGMNPFYQIDSSNATPAESMGSESGNWGTITTSTVFKMTMDTDGQVISYVDITGGGTFEIIKTSTRNATAGTYYIHVAGKELGGANDVTFSVIKDPAWVEKGTA